MEPSKHDIQATLTLPFKGCKAAETAHGINEMIDEEMTSECSTQKWFERFHNGELKSEGRGHILDAHLSSKTVNEKNPYKTTYELAKELQVNKKLPVAIYIQLEN